MGWYDFISLIPLLRLWDRHMIIVILELEKSRHREGRCSTWGVGKTEWDVGSPWPQAGLTSLPGSRAGDRHPHWVYHPRAQVTQPEGRQQNPGYWPAWPGSFFPGPGGDSKGGPGPRSCPLFRQETCYCHLSMPSPVLNALRRLSPGARSHEAQNLESIELDTDTPNLSVSGMSQRKEPGAGKAKRRKTGEKGSSWKLGYWR